MGRGKIYGVIFSLTIGIASWALSLLVEPLKWLPYVALPSSLTVLGLVGALSFFDYKRAKQRVGLPGFGVHMAIRIADIREERRQYIFDWYNEGKEGAAFFLSASRRFTFCIWDANGEPYSLEVPAGWMGFPIADEAYFGLEAGTDGIQTVMRAILNGRVIGERVLPFVIRFGDQRLENGMIMGANRNRHENGGFTLNCILFVSRTLTDDEAHGMKSHMAERTGVH